ncbi:hypothetical protein RJ639_019027 [Escallonia herrerae]|uniref:MULE transposase domain-containing protein n=1 Tax=Escallonia herrerae TaxID=1293975 RepID=A0AA89AHV8_9ASTE|nr:hypothetical protein RJ639_019027 [Escallonia herrerae]
MERAMAEEQRQAVLRDQLSGTIQLWPGRDIMWYECYIKCIVGNSVLDKANLDEDYEQYLVQSLVDQASREISTAETKENWSWFLKELVDDLGGYENLIFIFDRQKGLVESFKDLLPTTEQRFCMRHISLDVVRIGYFKVVLEQVYTT